MPIFSRSATGMAPCVMLAGWQARDSTPPRLSAKMKSRSLPTKRSTAARPPAMVKETMPGNPRICRRGHRVPRVILEPREEHRAHLRMTAQRPGNGKRVGLVALHAHGQGLQPPLHEEAVERGGHPAGGVLVEPAASRRGPAGS